MEAITGAYGKNLEANMTADGARVLIDRMYSTGMITKPFRMTIERDPDLYGRCTTSFVDDICRDHVIVVEMLNDALMAHEFAHARVNEKYGYDAVQEFNSHGKEFHKALYEIIAAVEGDYNEEGM